MMFGDMGHGGLLFIFAAFLVYCEPWLRKGPMKGDDLLLNLRYLLLLMGFFAFYCGFIYNDFVSIPIAFFDSCYDYKTGKKIGGDDCFYPAGVDPIWYLSSNEIAFTNSMKMKMSVIFGVGHMTLGIL